MGFQTDLAVLTPPPAPDPFFLFCQTKFKVRQFILWPQYNFIYVIFQTPTDFIPPLIYALVLQRRALLAP